MSVMKWGFDQTPMFFKWSANGPVCAFLSEPSDHERPVPSQALVEILTLEEGRGLTNLRLNRSSVGDSLRYRGHEVGADELLIHQESLAGVKTTTRLKKGAVVGVYRAETIIFNGSAAPLHLQAVTTLCLGGIAPALGSTDELDVWSAANEWCAENRWFPTPLLSAPGLPDINAPSHGQAARGTISRIGTSTWPSGQFLPMGAISNRHDGRTLMWQIEHNGPWIWEVNSQFELRDWPSLSLSGPTDLQHSWLHVLAPGQSFTTVSASLAFSPTSFDAAVGALVSQRRNTQLQPKQQQLGLVFNDYMNTLMGDPTTEKLLPLIDAAGEIGAEYFVIDAGWYDDDHGDWWPSVGEWKPAESRFGPDGFTKILDVIRDRGMKPGLWLEPEVVGVKSSVAELLPDEAFMTRMGVRIREHDRFFLDFRSSAAREYLDSVFERILGEYGIKFIKWDYNVTPGVGPGQDADSPGQALLSHCREYLRWFRKLRREYPDVIFESCASGAMREDPQTTAHYDLQSTSDQQDYLRYAAIAAAAPTIIEPEKAGNWAYPHPGMTLEETGFCLVNGLAGRMYLSGHLNRMRPEQIELIKEASALYPQMMDHHSEAFPVWPTGLPQWDSNQICLGLKTDKQLLLFLWHRADTADTADSWEIPLGDQLGTNPQVESLFPLSLPQWNTQWDPASGILRISPQGAGPQARIIAVR